MVKIDFPQAIFLHFGLTQNPHVPQLKKFSERNPPPCTSSLYNFQYRALYEFGLDNAAAMSSSFHYYA